MLVPRFGQVDYADTARNLGNQGKDRCILSMASQRRSRLDDAVQLRALTIDTGAGGC